MKSEGIILYATKGGGSLRQTMNKGRRAYRIWVAVLILLLPALTARGESTGTAESKPRIVAFGDSLTAGYGLESGLGFAPQLQATLRRHGIAAEVVPMDGFHLDNALLDARGLRAKKGAPETFDVAGFIALIHRLKTEADVVYPLFDRARDLSVAGGHQAHNCIRRGRGCDQMDGRYAAPISQQGIERLGHDCRREPDQGQDRDCGPTHRNEG